MDSLPAEGLSVTLEKFTDILNMSKKLNLQSYKYTGETYTHTHTHTHSKTECLIFFQPNNNNS